MNTRILNGIILSLILLCLNTFATETEVYGKITKIYPHKSGGQVFFQITKDNVLFPDPAHPDKSIVILNASTEGRNVYALLLSAASAGNSVHVTFDDARGDGYNPGLVMLWIGY